MNFKIALTEEFLSDLASNNDIYLFASRYGKWAGTLEVLSENTYANDSDKTSMLAMPTEFDETSKTFKICMIRTNITKFSTLYLLYNTESRDIPTEDIDGTWKLGVVLKITPLDFQDYTTNYVTFSLADYVFRCNIITYRSVTNNLYEGDTASVFVTEHNHITNYDEELSDIYDIPYFIDNVRSIKTDSVNTVGNLADGSLLLSDNGTIYQVTNGNLVAINTLPNNLDSIINSDLFKNNQLRFDLEDFYTVGDFKIRLLGDSLPEIQNPTVGQLNALVTNIPGNPSTRDLYYINLPSTFHYYGMNVSESVTSFNDGEFTNAGTYRLVSRSLIAGPLNSGLEYTYTGILIVSNNSNIVRQELVTAEGDIYIRCRDNEGAYTDWGLNVTDLNVQDYNNYDVIIQNQTEFDTLIATWANSTNTAKQAVAIMGGSYTLNSALVVPSYVTTLTGFNSPTIVLNSATISKNSGSSILCSLLNLNFSISESWGANVSVITDFSNVINCTVNVSNLRSTGFRVFSGCTNLINCSVTISSSVTGVSAVPYYNCNFLSNCFTNRSTDSTPYQGSTNVDPFTCTNYLSNLDDIKSFLSINYAKNSQTANSSNLDGTLIDGVYKVTDDNGFNASYFSSGTAGQPFYLRVSKCSTDSYLQMASSNDGKYNISRAYANGSWSAWYYGLTASYVNGRYQIIVSESKKCSSVMTMNNFSTEVGTLVGYVSNVGDSATFICSSSVVGGPTWTDATISTAGAGVIQKIGDIHYQVTVYHGSEFAINSINGTTLGTWCYPLTNNSTRGRTVVMPTIITSGSTKFMQFPMAGLSTSAINARSMILVINGVTAASNQTKLELNTSIISTGLGSISVKVSGTLANEYSWLSNSGGASVSLALQSTDDNTISEVRLGKYNNSPAVFILFSGTIETPSIVSNLTMISPTSNNISDTCSVTAGWSASTSVPGYTNQFGISINAGSRSYMVTDQIGNTKITSLFEGSNDSYTMAKRSNTVSTGVYNTSTTYKLLGVPEDSSGAVTPVILSGVSVINGQLRPSSVNTQG